jgi:hypothetical protein
MTHPTRQLTLRGFDSRLARELERVARQEGISLNKAALRLMRLGAGLEEQGAPATIGHSLDDLIGTWTRREAESFLRSIESCDQVDEELWR